ncbi:MAG: hypothetical protein JW994_01510 [Candidatus Omnitrophica bacterium]|nr:hypothetical protein [Candidatus Omnitrophota bacterium]
MKASKKNILYNIVALFIGFFLVFIILFVTEISLRFKYDSPAKFFFSLDPKLLNHVALFRRSPVPSKGDPAPRVFCLGGSTTNGNNMPMRQSYPNILDVLFKYKGRSGTAYNFGISGVSAVTTNFFIKNIVSLYNPSCVVIHDGYNDLPIVIKKLGRNSYSFIVPDYNKPFNPYVHNPVLRYVTSFIKFNLRDIRRFLVTFVKDTLKKGGDLFLGFDYKAYRLHTGNTEDILAENQKRMKIMFEKETDSIDYCIKNGIKVIIILEPYIKPHHFMPPFKTGFRDENVGEILRECHVIQQTLFFNILVKKYKGNDNVVILDMRKIFKGKYRELFYDECHLNGKGNAIKAFIVYKAVDRLFPETQKDAS